MSKSDKNTVATAKISAEKPDNKRRNFLIGAGLGSVGVAAAAATALSGATPEAKPASEPVAEGKGYQETEHVRRYYGTTRL